MLKLLDSRAQAGVDIKVIGRVSRADSKLQVRKPSLMRLHTRTIIRDGTQAFIGSQSLREIELGSRREVGIVFRDKKIVCALARIFHDDWDAIERAVQQPVQEDASQPAGPQNDAAQLAKVAKKVAKAITKDLPPVAPVLRVVVRELVGENGNMDLAAVVEESVQDAVKEAVKNAVRDVVETVVEQTAEQNGALPTHN
jgi:hypothetical protein